MRLKQFLEDKGYQALIYSKWVKKKKYYVVCIGKYEEKERAEKFGGDISKKYRVEFRVIDLKQLHFIR